MTADIQKILGEMSLAFSITFFVLGMYFPLLSTCTKIVMRFGYEEITVLKSIQMFFESKEYFLTIVIFLFTFLMPILEFTALLVRIFWNKTNRFLHHLDKWNMLDVFLVALLLLNFKMRSNIMVMQLKTGTTFIALSVIFRIITITLLNSLKIKKQ
jgi:uncharacterized paraquat-inducible protein A